MSAWMCSANHIMLLGVLMSQRGIPVGDSIEPHGIAQKLYAANVASLKARYPSDYAEMVGYDEDDLDAVGVSEILITIAGKSPLWLDKQVACFDYQACEVDGYSETPAGFATTILRDGLNPDRAEYPDSAPWGID